MKVIVWDLDDVLNPLTEAWFHHVWLPEHLACSVAYAALQHNPPLAELAVTRDDYLTSLDRFRLSPAGLDLAPNPTVAQWFKRHGPAFHHHVLTARPLNSVPQASAWVFRHFGPWIRHFHFIPSERADAPLPTYDVTKADCLRRLGRVDYFIDDSLDNIRAAAQAGICSLAFPQPWNDPTVPLETLLEQLQ